jgi:hypothetical protein
MTKATWRGIFEYTTGWWLTYPSEKYESQLGLLFPIYGKNQNVPNHQPDYVIKSLEHDSVSEVVNTFKCSSLRLLLKLDGSFHIICFGQMLTRFGHQET